MRPPIPPIFQVIICGGVSSLIANKTERFDYSWTGTSLLGAILIFAGILLIIAALGEFKRAKTTINPMDPSKAQNLVADGLYKYTRNPMYLSLLLLLIGYAILQSDFLALLGPVLFLVMMTELQIKPEESALREKFGAAYEAYCQRTRRWI